MFLESLLAQGYIVKDRLKHEEIIPFVQKNLKSKTVASVGYIVVNVALVIALIVVSVESRLGADIIFSKLGLGVSLTLLLIPVHEVIHGITYSVLGAKSVRYGGNLKKLVFYAAAHEFVADRRQFTMVALAPFVLISAALGVSLLFLSEANQYMVYAMLVFHTASCSGDFALVGYFEKHAGQGMITFDDCNLKESYFLVPATVESVEKNFS